ncbi:uncharacterized protein LAESUDRAFT_664263 [Laetiporus sulphureus 93-53]|uniref:Uncharacterized protein n=1 Tax=Laetiporus sulphureus 93-53 TaxID=1314785 RepID=A0A165BLC4_9APHY|nr:uncharacterized protein LAESUDRAFT_664263 [Laetiporus sulphureus 93-53]KZT01263.1 hypothetical protein LAESUDRAFT_664263 [Laetiporus sulphureus 93-53]
MVEKQETEVFVYKNVANRVKPIMTTLPEEFQIVQRKLARLLEELPTLPVHPPEFKPWGRYT